MHLSSWGLQGIKQEIAHISSTSVPGHTQAFPTPVLSTRGALWVTDPILHPSALTELVAVGERWVKEVFTYPFIQQ